MCLACWKSGGSSTKLPSADKVRDFLVLYNKVYEAHGAGGGLHTVLDDWNLEDEDIERCMNEREGGLTKEERDCANLLLSVSLDSRYGLMWLTEITFPGVRW